MLQLENALDNFRSRPSRLMDLHIGSSIFRYDGLLFREIPNTLENEIRGTGGDLHIQLLPQSIHIPANLLEVRARHVDNAGKVQARDLNVLHIRVEEFQKVVRHRGLLRVLHPDAEFVRVIGGQIHGQRIIVRHRLDQLEEVDHVHPEHMLRWAIVGLKPIRMEAEIDQDRVGLVYGHDLDTLRIELQIRLGQNLLQRLNKCTEGPGLYSFDFEQVPIRVWFD